MPFTLLDSCQKQDAEKWEKQTRKQAILLCHRVYIRRLWVANITAQLFTMLLPSALLQFVHCEATQLKALYFLEAICLSMLSDLQNAQMTAYLPNNYGHSKKKKKCISWQHKKQCCFSSSNEGWSNLLPRQRVSEWECVCVCVCLACHPQRTKYFQSVADVGSAGAT